MFRNQLNNMNVNVAQVNGTEMRQWIDELLKTLLDMLGDASSPEKRGVALWVLGQLVSATGYVVKPYNDHTTLLDVLLNLLKTEQQPIIRREAIRVLGLLGALDPYKHKMNLGLIDSTMLLSMVDTSKSDVEMGYGEYILRILYWSGKVETFSSGLHRS